MNIKKRIAILLAGSTIIAGTATGIAVAAIPDSSGVVHGCYSKLTGNLKVIDSEAGDICSSVFEKPLTWNQTGPQGVQGSQGPSGDSQPKSTIIYSQRITTGPEYYLNPCPTQYYFSAFSVLADDGSSITGAPESYNPSNSSTYISVYSPYTVYSTCTYYGSVHILP